MQAVAAAPCTRAPAADPTSSAPFLSPPPFPDTPPRPFAQVDELLEAAGVRLCGEGAAHAVTVRHPGLTLFPLDDESVDAAGPQLQVMAALLAQEDEESSSEEEEGAAEEAGRA